MNKVSVVIPTWNAAQDVERALKSMLPLEVDGEILVVDNGVINTDTELAVQNLQKIYPYLRYLKFEKQLGYAGAVNAGMAAAKYRYVAVMNNDNTTRPGWLIALLNEIQNTANCAITSANVQRENVPVTKGGLSLFGRITYTNEPMGNTPYDVFQPDGSAFLLDKEKINTPYEDEYFIYHEDSALGWKAHLMGYCVRMVPEAKVSTFDGGSTRRIPYKTAFYTERNRWLNYLIFPEFSTILKCLPLWLLDSFACALFRKNIRARIHAWAWVATHIFYVKELRYKMQQLRKQKDKEILRKLFGRYHPKIDGILFSYFRIIGLHLQR